MRCGWVVGLALAALAVGQDAQPDPAKKEYDLTWRLPHDRAAVYDVWDVAKKAKRGEFWLLGCELDGRVGVTHGPDLPFRYVFRNPPKTVSVGSTWEVMETAFAESSAEDGGVPAVQVLGSYLLKEVERRRLSDLFKIAARGSNEEILVALTEGMLTISHCRREGGNLVPREPKPSGLIAVQAAIRVSDGAILGARFQLNAKLGTYSIVDNAKVGRTEDAAELIFKEPLVELSPSSLKGRIDKSIEQGVAWLRRKQSSDGRLVDTGGYIAGTAFGAGSTALTLLAWLHSGVKPDHKSVTTGFSYLASKELTQSYDLGPYLMALEARCLSRVTGSDFTSLSEQKAAELLRNGLTRDERATAAIATRRLIQIQSTTGAFGYTGEDMANMSNSQYALLGLKSAARMGASIPNAVWKRSLAYVEKAPLTFPNQTKVSVTRHGGAKEERTVKPIGWGYLQTENPVASAAYEATGTMTSAALTILAVCRSELSRNGEWSEELAKRVEHLEWGALAWLQGNFGIRATRPEGCFSAAAMPFYYLYGLERALILTDVRMVGSHDWYPEGTALLLSNQNVDGSWAGPHGTPIVDTAFALLFLKRATIPVATPSGRKP